jgi:hypothetical protein
MPRGLVLLLLLLLCHCWTPPEPCWGQHHLPHVQRQQSCWDLHQHLHHAQQQHHRAWLLMLLLVLVLRAAAVAAGGPVWWVQGRPAGWVLPGCGWPLLLVALVLLLVPLLLLAVCLWAPLVLLNLAVSCCVPVTRYNQELAWMSRVVSVGQAQH